MNYQEDELNFIKKYKNLVGRDYLTRFLDLNEQALLKSLDKDALFFGGYDEAERKQASTLGYYNISLLKVSYNHKFGKIRHKDILGAIYSLGLDISVIGDIEVNEEEAFFFVDSNYVAYFIDNLTKIKNFNVKLEEISLTTFKHVDKGVLKKAFVKSFRLDLLISEAFNLSRDVSKSLILKEFVRVNSKEITNPSLIIKEGDLVSVRTKGRFILDSIGNTSKSGNYFVNLKLYK